MKSAATLIIGVQLALLARPAGSETIPDNSVYSCMASAEFSGNEIQIYLDLDGRGRPTSGSNIRYYPAGARSELAFYAAYPITVDHSIANISFLQGRTWVSPSQASGSFLLTIDGQDYKSRPGTVGPGPPGKVEVKQFFKMEQPLVAAIAKGASGRLAYLDRNGMTLAEADLTFTAKTVVQDAVDKTYPTALAYATHKAKC